LVTVPASVLQYGMNLPRFKVLPVELPLPPWPVGVITLKNRTISPVAQLFLDCAREVAQLPSGTNAATISPADK
jgi:DNA-binding transcriptional LysR family regulator